MHSYKDQLRIVSQIKMLEGDRKTLDCPFCGGQKKFTIERRFDGRLLWNCFRASCNAKGVKQGERSVAAAKAYVTASGNEKRLPPGIPLPSFTTRIENRLEAGEYLRTANAYQAYKDGLVRVRYDPKSDRVLFYNRSETGAVGRRLSIGPKWLSYGDTSGGLHIGKGDNAVLVEDAASACAVARVAGFTGIAMLGTYMTSYIKKTLQLYKQLYIILDNDASNKALSLTRQLRKHVRLRVTTKDPKELTVTEIVELLEGNPNNCLGSVSDAT